MNPVSLQESTEEGGRKVKRRGCEWARETVSHLQVKEGPRVKECR